MQLRTNVPLNQQVQQASDLEGPPQPSKQHRSPLDQQRRQLQLPTRPRVPNQSLAQVKRHRSKLCRSQVMTRTQPVPFSCYKRKALGEPQPTECMFISFRLYSGSIEPCSLQASAYSHSASVAFKLLDSSPSATTTACYFWRGLIKIRFQGPEIQ